MEYQLFPFELHNWIAGQEVPAKNNALFEKINPGNGRLLCRAARSTAREVDTAVAAARRAYHEWSRVPGVKRGEYLYCIADGMQKRQDKIARIVALETGKSFKDALGETKGAIALARFMAGEGQRLYGRTTTSAVANKYAMTIRQPIGVAGLIVAANTPIANVAWKVFPALVCGNTAVLKAAEDAPATAWIIGQLARDCGLPEGVLNIVHGYGEEAGAPLAAHEEVDVISFTGSTEVGRQILQVAGKRLAKVSLELGGKNPFIVCDDADLENAVHWAALSAFSNAGQRCAAASRIIVFAAVYEEFKKRLIAKTENLRVGSEDRDDFGPVINARQLERMLAALDRATAQGARILTGGKKLDTPQHRNGFYMAPTLVENAAPRAEISTAELFGPIACLYEAQDFEHAMALANDSPYGLTACIHTRNVNRAMRFTQEIESGVAVVNAGTYGSEPHMPFGGLKQSGNGWREPGTEALDVYSELKDVYVTFSGASL